MVYVFQEKIKYEVHFYVQSCFNLSLQPSLNLCLCSGLSKNCKAVDKLKIQNTGFKWNGKQIEKLTVTLLRKSTEDEAQSFQVMSIWEKGRNAYIS